jgi:hypothetical protein
MDEDHFDESFYGDILVQPSHALLELPSRWVESNRESESKKLTSHYFETRLTVVDFNGFQFCMSERSKIEGKVRSTTGSNSSQSATFTIPD